jgi:hypothetical protein
VTSPLPPDEQAKHLIEMWKQTVSVQQHFNDLCWRIRGLALTALTFAVGAAAVAVREPVVVRLFDRDIQLSTVILLLGLAVWQAFYYVDRQWYHRLLKGAVTHGEELEALLRGLVPLPVDGLTKAISKASRYEGRPPPTFRKVEVTSTRRLGLFYGAVSLLLIALAVTVQIGATAEHNAPSGAPAPSVADG